MGTKSLPTFKHTSIGAKTHKARTTTAHVSYIMRSEAMTKFQCENMPDGGRGTRVFFDKLWEKAGMPENARRGRGRSQQARARRHVGEAGLRSRRAFEGAACWHFYPSHNPLFRSRSPLLRS